MGNEVHPDGGSRAAGPLMQPQRIGRIRYCPKCNATPLRDTDSFCGWDGEPLDWLDPCPQCGRRMAPGHKFCAEGGQMLTEPAAL